MLNSMQTRFGEMNKSIVDRIDQMGGKIDELENSIQELVKEASEQANNAEAVQQQNQNWSKRSHIQIIS